MPTKHLPIAQILTILEGTPQRLAKVTATLTPKQLQAAHRPGEWSVSEVLAHLRACCDVWGDRYIATALAEDDPTIKAINPTTWIKNTDYLTQDFQTALRAFASQRRKLLKALKGLAAEDWARTNTLIGAGKPLRQTLISHADGLARHERAHLKQIERTVGLLVGAGNPRQEQNTRAKTHSK